MVYMSHNIVAKHAICSGPIPLSDGGGNPNQVTLVPTNTFTCS